MFGEKIKESSVISLVSEEVNDEEGTYIGVLRVHNEQKWLKYIQKLLLKSAEDEEYGVSVRKEFTLSEENKPSYSWVLILWGDLEQAETSLSPILAKRGAPPRPPKSLGVTTAPTKSVTTHTRNVGGTIESVGTVPLPFKRGTRDGNPDETVKVSKGGSSRRGVRATVSTIQ